MGYDLLVRAKNIKSQNELETEKFQVEQNNQNIGRQHEPDII